MLAAILAAAASVVLSSAAGIGATRPMGHERPTLKHATAVAKSCNTATSWAEQTAPGVWRGVCGDDWGHELIGNDPSSFAELHWAMATAAGADSDAAFEDAFATRAGEERRGEYQIELQPASFAWMTD